jgi:phage/plasmid-like protein (TIGR03299 family)
MALLNSHDGSGACKVLFTQVRVVCANTIQAADADGDRTGLQFSFRHTTGMSDRIEDAKEAIKLARIEATRWRTMAAELGHITLTDDQVQTFLDEFMPHPPAGTASERVVANVDRDRKKFMHLLDASLTNCEMARTGLGVVNAAVEYLDHARGFQNRDTYMGRQLLRPEPLKAKAIKLVRQLANA